MNELELTRYILELVSYISIILGLVIFIHYKKQLNFDVVSNCMVRFQGLLENESGKIKHLKKYADLCNEQLFYIQNRYIKKEIALEWIDGMSDFLPLYKNNNFNENINNNSQCLFNGENLNLINGYDRITHTFNISENVDFELNNGDLEGNEKLENNRKKTVYFYSKLIRYKY